MFVSLIVKPIPQPDVSVYQQTSGMVSLIVFEL